MRRNDECDRIDCVHRQNRYRFRIGKRISAKQDVENEIQILLDLSRQRDKVSNDTSRNETKIDSRMYDWFLCVLCMCIYIYLLASLNSNLTISFQNALNLVFIKATPKRDITDTRPRVSDRYSVFFLFDFDRSKTSLWIIEFFPSGRVFDLRVQSLDFKTNTI